MSLKSSIREMKCVKISGEDNITACLLKAGLKKLDTGMKRRDSSRRLEQSGDSETYYKKCFGTALVLQMARVTLMMIAADHGKYRRHKDYIITR